MSSSMRWRNGLMGLKLIGVSCLEVGVFDPSIPKTERPPRHLISSRVSGFVQWPDPEGARAERRHFLGSGAGASVFANDAR
jgi:hypothetical protein